MTLKKEQSLAIIILFRKCGVKDDARPFVMARLLGWDDDAPPKWSLEDWHRLRDMAYPDWDANDWTVGIHFISRVNALVTEYRETVLGQLRLF